MCVRVLVGRSVAVRVAVEAEVTRAVAVAAETTSDTDSRHRAVAPPAPIRPRSR